MCLSTPTLGDIQPLLGAPSGHQGKPEFVSEPALINEWPTGAEQSERPGMGATSSGGEVVAGDFDEFWQGGAAALPRSQQPPS